MPWRSIFVWKLEPVLRAEAGIKGVVDKARRAHLSALWVKVAEGAEPYRNVTDAMAAEFSALIHEAHTAGIEIWGWHVPHCGTVAEAEMEAAVFGAIVRQFNLDGLIMDAEGADGFFRGSIAEAGAYGAAMRTIAARLRKPLAISSNDVPREVPGWLAKFTTLAQLADLNLPQAYYGADRGVADALDRAAAGNVHAAIPFAPVGSAFVGRGEGCASEAACAEQAVAFIHLCRERGYPGCSFWHWEAAPAAFWRVLEGTVP